MRKIPALSENTNMRLTIDVQSIVTQIQAPLT